MGDFVYSGEQASKKLKMQNLQKLGGVGETWEQAFSGLANGKGLKVEGIF